MRSRFNRTAFIGFKLRNMEEEVQKEEGVEEVEAEETPEEAPEEDAE